MTTLFSDGNPQTHGAKVTFTAHVTTTNGKDASTGRVRFRINGGTATTVTLDDTGHARYCSSTMAVGKHTITADYLGDSTYAESDASFLETITPSSE